jgi:NADH-quinone oxidoreductase subunit M
MPIYPNALIFFLPYILVLILIAIIFSSLTTIRQIDLKKIIAYSSVAHMNFALLGLFINNNTGLAGTIYLMLGHGIVSSALFICVGILYDRYHNRTILYYGGLVQVMPLFSVCFLIFTLANISFPGTINFVGELLILISVAKTHIVILFISALGIILSVVYAI